MAKLPDPIKQASRSATRTLAWRAIPPQLYLIILLPTMGCAGGLVYLLGYSLSGGTRAGGIKGLLIMAAVLLGIMLVVGLVMLLKRRRAKKRARAFEASLKSDAAGSSGIMADPAEAARVDEIRQKFQKGVDVFRQYGKSVYDFPWYVMVGEPGAGKTEAIRHSSLHFPEGLQEKQQGVGGTYSMDWWFTDRAILLDTAGALLTEEASSARFLEFLKMLKGHRPDCPINGMIIAVSVQSLLTDDLEDADRKGLNLARQLSMIQKTLGIRFGVYVMITKSDLITGFKEFCDAPANAGYERQMLGWSNPYDVDYAISPSEVCRELEHMINELRYRRWDILQDPISNDRQLRRIDQVDALFALPDAMSEVITRLSRYLDIMFSGGEWAEMPPFFRGVYFTSSRREGSALDQQLARALRLPADRLPEGGIWEREKAVFLRDLFVEKVFHETGLVTRLRDIGAVMRKRLVFYYTLTSILVFSLLGLGLLFYGKIKRQLANEQRALVEANQLYDNGQFAPVVVKEAGVWVFNVKGQLKLEESLKAASDLKGFGFFRPLELFYDRSLIDERRQSHEVLVSGAIIKPLLDAAREKMLAPERVGIAQGVNEMEALLVLQKVEAAVGGDHDVFGDPVDGFVRPLLRYVVGENAGVSDAYLNKLRAFMKDFNWKGQEWMRRGAAMRGVAALDKGLNLFLGSHQQTEDHKKEVSAAIAAFRRIEDPLLSADRLSYDDARARLDALGQATESLNATLGGGAGDSELYGRVWTEMKTLCERNRDRAGYDFAALLRRLEGAAPAPEFSKVPKVNEGEAAAEQKDPEFLEYTRRTTRPGMEGRRLFEYRYALYEEMMKPELGDTKTLIGKMEAKMNALKPKPAPSDDGGKGEAFTKLCGLLAAHGVTAGKKELAGLWRHRVADLSVRSGAYPLVRAAKVLTTAEFEGLASEWREVEKDLGVLEELSGNVGMPPAFGRALTEASKVCDVVDLLWDADAKQIATVEVSFSGSRPERNELNDPPVLGPDGQQVRPGQNRVEVGRGIDYCRVFRADRSGKAGQVIVEGDLSEDKKGNAPVSDGLIIEYTGGPDFGAGRKVGPLYERFNGPWGILKAIELGGVSPAGPLQDVRLEVDFGVLTLSFRFRPGSYNKDDWITAETLLQAFKN